MPQEPSSLLPPMLGWRAHVTSPDFVFKPEIWRPCSSLCTLQASTSLSYFLSPGDSVLIPKYSVCNELLKSSVQSGASKGIRYQRRLRTEAQRASRSGHGCVSAAKLKCLGQLCVFITIWMVSSGWLAWVLIVETS